MMREPEYTPLSSQMDRILPTDLITFRSPSELEETREEQRRASIRPPDSTLVSYS